MILWYAYTWHCTGSYHSSHIQNLLKKSTNSEQLLSLRWLVGRACVSLLNMLDFGFPFLQLETDSSYRSHTFQECIHVTLSFNKCVSFNWSNNSNKIGNRSWLCKSLALKLQFSSTSSTILRLRVFFPHRKSAERRCFCSDLVSLHVPKDEPEPEPFYIKIFLKRINTLSESTEN